MSYDYEQDDTKLGLFSQNDLTGIENHELLHNHNSRSSSHISVNSSFEYVNKFLKYNNPNDVSQLTCTDLGGNKSFI